MPVMTLEEAKTQLGTINAAIQDIVAGKRVTQLRIGSNSFSRLYINQEISLESLTGLRNELLDFINALEPTAPVFRSNAHIPLVVTKGVW